MERSDCSQQWEKDLDNGYYKDRDSDAETGERREVIDDITDRESVLSEIVMISHLLSNKAEKRMNYAHRVKREALAELRDFNVEEN